MSVEKLRAKLEAELATLIDRKDRIEAHLKNVDREPPADWSELAIFRENDEVLEGLDEHTRAQVNALSAALQRMNTEAWGICIACEEPINARRLEVLPTATRCVDCAETAEAAKSP